MSILINFIIFFLSIPAFFLILHTIIRIVRSFYKFPMPQWMSDLIDNPLRQKIQPPSETATRHEIQEGMRVLEIGPGNGTYTIEAAKRVGPQGELFVIDIEPKIIERLKQRLAKNKITNIQPRVADVYDLPFESASFDLIFMITVINELPDIPKALLEFKRVLKSSGKLVFSELLFDPDYPLAYKLIQTVQSAGFQLVARKSNFIFYTLVFEKVSES